MIEILSVLLLGLTNRIRGGLFGERIRKLIPIYGTTAGRLVYSASFGVVYYLLSGQAALSAAVVPAIFLGYAIAPFAPWQYMAERGDLLALSGRGLILNGPAGIAIAAFNADLVLGLTFTVSGALMGLIYLASKQLPLLPFLSDTDIKDTNDTAEVLVGMYHAMALITLMNFS